MLQHLFWSSHCVSSPKHIFANPKSLNESYVILINFILPNLFACDMPAATLIKLSCRCKH